MNDAARKFAARWPTACACALILLALGCGKDASPPAAIVPAKAVASAPAPTPAPNNMQNMMTRIAAVNQCTLAASPARGVDFHNYAQVLASKGIVAELANDAMTYAAEDVAFYERIGPPTNDAERVANYLHALGDTGAVLVHPDDVRLRASALEAYYNSMLVEPQCQLDPDILKLINKTKP
jgi:hypothetical protein